MRATGPQTIGYSNDHPGGYGEYVRLTESLLLPVPADLPTDHAALTEPMAVGACRRQGQSDTRGCRW
jgi:threonine dehydrogenase-like Zn-dependent dehydrogenase